LLSFAYMQNGLGSDRLTIELRLLVWSETRLEDGILIIDRLRSVSQYGNDYLCIHFKVEKVV